MAAPSSATHPLLASFLENWPAPRPHPSQSIAPPRPPIPATAPPMPHNPACSRLPSGRLTHPSNFDPPSIDPFHAHTQETPSACAPQPKPCLTLTTRSWGRSTRMCSRQSPRRRRPSVCWWRSSRTAPGEKQDGLWGPSIYRSRLCCSGGRVVSRSIDRATYGSNYHDMVRRHASLSWSITCAIVASNCVPSPDRPPPYPPARSINPTGPSSPRATSPSPRSCTTRPSR